MLAQNEIVPRSGSVSVKIQVRLGKLFLLIETLDKFLKKKKNVSVFKFYFANQINGFA